MKIVQRLFTLVSVVVPVKLGKRDILLYLLCIILNESSANLKGLFSTLKLNSVLLNHEGVTISY